MIALPNTYYPVQGKTYSLFGEGFTTHQYFSTIEEIINVLTQKITLNELLIQVQNLSKISLLKRVILKEKADNSINGDIIDLLEAKLSSYTAGAQNHLKELNRLKLNDTRLWTTQKQHHLYMLEIGIVNRLNLGAYKNCDYKIALLPHCIRNKTLDCKAQKDDFDEVCGNCSKACLIGTIDAFLKTYNIKSYVWSGINFTPLFKKYRSQGKSFGVLGIACIPELRKGMRNCLKYDIPVAGMPLNANRCESWMGEQQSTSVDLTQLEKMLED